MENNDSDLLLLSDLICLYNNSRDEKYLNEIRRRMIFCGFTVPEINEFIYFENNIINSSKRKYDKRILDNYYIIGKNKKNKIFEYPELYMFDPKKDNSKTLMISETLAIIDEAVFITYSSKLSSYKAKDEIISLSEEKSSNWLFYEFRNRIEYICRCANRIIDGPDTALYNDKNNILYDNEMQICIMRWKNIEVGSRNFIPYTEQYFY